MARTTTPLDEPAPDAPKDHRLEVIYSTVVLLVVAFAFWTFPVRAVHRLTTTEDDRVF